MEKPQEPNREINPALVGTLINYLQRQPYGEVYQLIQALAALPPVEHDVTKPFLPAKEKAS